MIHFIYLLVIIILIILLLILSLVIHRLNLLVLSQKTETLNALCRNPGIPIEKIEKEVSELRSILTGKQFKYESGTVGKYCETLLEEVTLLRNNPGRGLGKLDIIMEGLRIYSRL